VLVGLLAALQAILCDPPWHRHRKSIQMHSSSSSASSLLEVRAIQVTTNCKLATLDQSHTAKGSTNSRDIFFENVSGARPRDPKKRLVKKADDKKAHENFNEPMKKSCKSHMNFFTFHFTPLKSKRRLH
jgi:hypothetical protein